MASKTLSSLLGRAPVPLPEADPMEEDANDEEPAQQDAVEDEIKEVGEADGEGEDIEDDDDDDKNDEDNGEEEVVVGGRDAKGKLKKFNILYPRKGLRLEQFKLGSARLWVQKIIYAPPKPRVWPKPTTAKDPQPVGAKVEPRWDDVYELQLYSKKEEATFFALAVQMPPGEEKGNLCFKALTKTAEEILIMVRQFNNSHPMTSLEQAQKRIFAYRNRISEEEGFVSDNTVIEWDQLRGGTEFTGPESFYYTPELLFGEPGPYLPPHIFQKQRPQEAELQGHNDLIMEPGTDDNNEMEEVEFEPPGADLMEGVEEADPGNEDVEPDAGEHSEENRKAMEKIPWQGREEGLEKPQKPKTVPAVPKQNSLFDNNGKTPPKKKVVKVTTPATIPAAVQNGLQPRSDDLRNDKVGHITPYLDVTDIEEVQKVIQQAENTSLGQHARGGKAPRPTEVSAPVALPEKKSPPVKAAPKAGTPKGAVKTPANNMPPKRAVAVPVPVPAASPEPVEKKRKAPVASAAKAVPAAAAPEPVAKKQASEKPRGKARKPTPNGIVLSSINRQIADKLDVRMSTDPALKKSVHAPGPYVEELSAQRTGPEWFDYLDGLVALVGVADSPDTAAKHTLNMIVVVLEMISEKAGKTELNFGELAVLMSAPAKAKTSRTKADSAWNLIDNLQHNLNGAALAECLTTRPIMLYTWLQWVVKAQHCIQSPFLDILKDADVKLEWKDPSVAYGTSLFKNHKGVVSLIYNTCTAILSSAFSEKEESDAPAEEEAADPMAELFG